MNTNTQGYLPFDDPSIRNVLMKVKSGVYRPPSTHPLIVDLISKILVVDVNKRFTIKQIKEHPAFTMHLPDGYTLPKPLPPPSVTEKVEVTDEKFFMLLKNIGFESDEAIKEELAAPTSTAAKLFYILYEDKLNIKNLPWKSNEQSSPSSSLSQFLISNESSPFDHQDDMQSSTQSSSMYSSFKESKKWDLPFMEEEEETEEVRTIHFQKITTNYLQLTKVIQSEITKEGYMFFYPDDQTLFVHRMDQESYYTLTINQAINNESELEVCQNYGSQQDFTEFEEIIVRVISEYSFVQQ